MPSGNSIIDPDGLSSGVQKSLVETTVLRTSQTKFASLTLDVSQSQITVDTRTFTEKGVHLISVKMTDGSGAHCTY